MDLYRLSRATKRAIDAAEQAAVRAGHDRLASVHLLVALAEPGTAPAAALARRGVAPDAIAREADAVYEGPRGGRARDLERGDEWREALEGARDEADNAGSHEIEPAHLFLAATSDDAGTAYRVLRALGVDVEALRADVEAIARTEDRAGAGEAGGAP